MAYPVTQPDPTKVVGRRVAAILLDAIVVIIPAIVILTMNFEYTDVEDLNDVSGEEFCDNYIDQVGGDCVDLEDVNDRVYYSDDSHLSSTGFYWIANMLILVVLQGFTGWTPGKLIMGIRVIGEDGNRPGFVKALLRWILWIADGFPYVIPGLTGFIVALSTPGHRRIGDIVARTFVVKRAAIGQPMTIGDGNQVIVGELTPSAVAPAWAPPPAEPGAPTGWGPAVDPTSAGWASPPAEAPTAAATPPAAPSPSTEGPQWDEARGTYIQWDPAQGAWMQWDEGFKAWIVIPGQ